MAWWSWIVVSAAVLGFDSSTPEPERPNAATARQASVVASWHLDERSGTTARDSSGHGHDGAIVGPVALGIPGKAETAYRFVPQSAVVVRDAPDLHPGRARVTISYWLKLVTRPPSYVTDYDIFVKGDAYSRGGQMKLEVQRNGQASCMFRGALGEKQLQAGPNLINGRWHKVTCQRVGDRIIATVDGRSYSVTKATGAITNTQPIRLGSHRGGGDWYQGALDEVSYRIG